MANPDAAQQAEVARRRGRAIDMRTGGATWQAVADALGYASRGAACTDVQRALEIDRAELAETADAHRQLELERLDRLIRAATAVLDRKHITVSHGRIILDADGEPLLDDAPVLQAIDRITRLSESRRKLLGLDAPAKAELLVPGETFVGVINLGLEGS